VIANFPAVLGALFSAFFVDDRRLGSSGVTERRFTCATPIRSAQGAKNPLAETIGGVAQQCQTTGIIGSSVGGFIEERMMYIFKARNGTAG
jgi:hypothetical protein